MMSEVRVLPATSAWGGAYSEAQVANGGQTFCSVNPPNSPLPDNIVYGRGSVITFFLIGVPYPTNVNTTVDPRYSLRIGARSRHEGGINASHCDGSVTFYADGIDLAVWRALSTAQGADAPIAAATKPVRRTK
jgi:prepilin-type processing-associated H-X9-DG protein